MRGFGLVISAGLIACATVASAELRQVGPTSAKVIDGPGTVYRMVTTLAPGAKVQVVERYEGYALIRLPGGGTAWTKNSGLVAPGSVVKPAATVAKAKPAKIEDVDPYATVVWTKSGPLNMRKGPGTDHAVLSQCRRGDWVKVVRKAGVWAEIELAQGETGWVHTAYLTR